MNLSNTSQILTVEFQDGIGRIKINRPEKRNALTRELIEDLLKAVQGLQQRPELRAILFTAEGDVFCAGMDLGEMQARATAIDGKAQWQRDSEIYSELLSEIFTLPVPTIVCLQGPVLAGGVGMVLACDLIVASEVAFFSLPEPMRGITAAIVTPLLTYRIGAAAASGMLLSGERITAQRAFQLGLCHAISPPDQLSKRTEELLQAILTGAPAALTMTKRHLQRCTGSHVLEQLKGSIEVSAEARETADAREGLAAFLEKRKPNWYR